MTSNATLVLSSQVFPIEPIFVFDYREPLLKGLKKKLFYPLLMRFLL